MEERPPFETPESPSPPHWGAALLGVFAGLVVGIVPVLFGLSGLFSVLALIGGPSQLAIQIGVVALLVVVGIGIALKLASRRPPGFVRGLLVGLALSLLLTGGSLSTLLWMCGKGW